MIELLEGMPANVIGLSASGKGTSDDYEQAVFPAID